MYNIRLLKMFSVNHVKYSRMSQQVSKRSIGGSIHQKIKQKEEFLSVLPGVIDSLKASPKIAPLPEIGNWIKKLVEYNVSGGKYLRGLLTMNAYEMLEKPENITEEYLKLSKVLGWCVEIVQGYFLVLDDIMDKSRTRRGVPCWYLMPNVGMGAANDTTILSCCVTETLETYFVKTPHFNDLIRLFHEAILYSSMGQHIDFSMAHRTKHDYSLFTIERYNTIVQYKTSYYTFRLPILLGLTLVKDVDKGIYTDVQDISFKLGNLIQMQDDYIDCYGDEAITGKTGTDIQEGKCSWLAVTALQHCNESQREVFTKYYGSDQPEHVTIIKNLYNELRIPELYRQAKMALYDDINRRAHALPSVEFSNFFYKITETIYKVHL